MKIFSQVLAFLVVTSILSFEVSHTLAHAHELEHESAELSLELDHELDHQDHHVTVLDCIEHGNEHKHTSHGHLDLLSRDERFNTVNLKTPDFENENIDFLSSKKELLLSVKRTYYHIKDHNFDRALLYKNPLQFRNRILLI